MCECQGCQGANEELDELVELHPCPHQQEVEQNNEDFCNCCRSCTERCADEI